MAGGVEGQEIPGKVRSGDGGGHKGQQEPPWAEPLLRAWWAGMPRGPLGKPRPSVVESQQSRWGADPGAPAWSCRPAAVGLGGVFGLGHGWDGPEGAGEQRAGSESWSVRTERGVVAVPTPRRGWRGWGWGV